MESKAVLLLSGGIDSTTLLVYIKKKLNLEPCTIIFNYGQKQNYEITAAKKISSLYKVKESIIININLDTIGGSALTDKNINIPINNYSNKTIPPTYVPSRNIIFLSIAASWAETLNTGLIFYGANTIDYSGYPDCRGDFIDSFEIALNKGTKAGVETNRFSIKTPFLNYSKSDIVKLGYSLDIDYSNTVSCYNLNSIGKACGKCDSCYIRKKAFEKLNIIDPTKYV